MQLLSLASAHAPRMFSTHRHKRKRPNGTYNGVLSMSRSFNRNRKSLNRQLHLETLEDRSMPSCTSISGFVYFDANGNGLYDVGTESPIANSSIELHDANGDVVGTTTTDANGFYTFDMD